MTEKIWLKSYPQGVPHELLKSSYTSVADYIDRCCMKYQYELAIGNFGVRLSYAQFETLGTAFAGYLQQELGLVKGQRIAVMLPNLLQYPIVLLGALKAGLVVVNINPFYSPRELAAQLKDSGARILVLFEGCAHKLQDSIEGTALEYIIVTNVGDLFPWPRSLLTNLAVKHIKKKIPPWNLPNAIALMRALNKGSQFEPVPLDRDDIAFLQYTGGTTGSPKGAMLSHGNVLANIQQAYLWMRQSMRERQERVIVALPVYHVFALTVNFLSLLQYGGIQILITDPRDFNAFVSVLRKSRVSYIAGVNTLFAKLLDNAEFRRLDFSELRCVVGGGAAVQPSVAERWREITGTVICQAYGLTEASPGVCCNPLELKNFNGSVGLPVPSTTVEIRDDKGRKVTGDDVGELWVRGPQVMKGYWNNPDETAKVLTPEGWLRTGDLATMDENGYVRIVDRKKDMIIVSGFKVYPNEIEDLLVDHPGILDAGVVGEPHPVSGEVVKAFIVKSDPSLTKEAVVRYCRENVTGYKVPHRIVFLHEIPKTNVGKVLRRQLREG